MASASSVAEELSGRVFADQADGLRFGVRVSSLDVGFRRFGV